MKRPPAAHETPTRNGMKIVAALFGVAVLFMSACASPSPTTSRPAGKTWTLWSWDDGGAQHLRIDVPPRLVMTKNDGPDFDIYRFADPAAKSRMGIYAGMHPGLFSVDLDGVRTEAGRVGGVAVEWRHWMQDGMEHSEAIVQKLPGMKSRVLHVFIAGPTAEEVSRLETAAGTLRVEKGP